MISLLINNGSTLKQTLPPATSNIPMYEDIALPKIMKGDKEYEYIY